MAGFRVLERFSGSLEDDFGHHARRRERQQEADRLGDVLRPDHLLRRDRLLDEVGHRRVDEPGRERDRLDPVARQLLVHRLREADHRGLGGRVDRQPRLARLAGDRGEVDHERVAVLGTGGAQHLDALAVEEHDRAQVHVELHVDALGLHLGDRRPDAHPGAVDEHVEPAEAVAVAGDHALDLRLFGHVGRDLLDLVALRAQLLRRGGELLGTARGHGQPVAGLAQRVGDGEADAARGPRDDGGALRHPGIQSRTSLGPVRTPLVIIAALIVVLLGVSALGGSGGKASTAAGKPVAPVSVIARRVETLRHLRYRTIPQAKAATPDQARADGLADFDRSYPVARRHADEAMLTMLGLVPPGTSLRDVAASLYSEGVAGYYDPRSKKLRTVSGAATGTRVLAETVLAHELTHALEDQRFGLLDEADRLNVDSYRSLAQLALVEGSATSVMQQYMARYFSAEEALAGTLGSAVADTGDMPPFLEAQTVFPYLDGMRFVQSLRDRAGGSWSLVDTAERFRPPASTEQVMHPDRYIEVDAPKPVRLRVRLGDGCTRAAAGTWGELQ